MPRIDRFDFMNGDVAIEWDATSANATDYEYTEAGQGRLRINSGGRRHEGVFIRVYDGRRQSDWVLLSPQDVLDLARTLHREAVQNVVLYNRGINED